eukprot:1159500-Pelagomonas_calceolata.AAC.25
MRVMSTTICDVFFNLIGGVNAARRKRRPPLQEYIRHLIFVELSEQSIADVLKRLLRLPWAECERWVVPATTAVLLPDCIQSIAKCT